MNPRLRHRWARLRYWVRELFGENDYERYLQDWQARHAGQTPGEAHRPMTPREFFDWRLEQKYGGGFQRC